MKKTAINWTELKNKAIPYIPAAIALGGPLIGGTIADYIGEKDEEKRQQELRARLHNSFNRMLASNPSLSSKPELARARFNELADISPTLALHPSLNNRIIKSKLKTGFDADDLMKMYQIEYHKQYLDKGFESPETITQTFLRDSGTYSVLSDLAKDKINNMGEQAVEAENKFANTARAAVKGYERFFPRELVDLMSRPKSPETDEAINEWVAKNEQKWKEGIKKSGDAYNSKTASIQEALVKEAALPDAIKAILLRGLQGAALAGTAGIGVGAVTHLLSKGQQEELSNKIDESWRQTSRSLKDMTESQHNLTKGVDYNNPQTQQQVKEIFGALATIAPTIASSPSLARAFLNEAMTLGQGELSSSQIKTITDVQKNIDSSNDIRGSFTPSPFLQGFDRGFKTVGGQDIFQGVAKTITTPTREENK